MNIEQLKYFVEVCDSGSISRASQRLHISKQGLSRSIQRLETELDDVLFVRDFSGIQLTDAGNIVYQGARRLLDDYAELRHTLEKRQEEPKKRLRIAFPNGFFACLPVDLLFSFISAHPDLRCEQYSFKDMDLRDSFVDMKLDLALCSGPREDPRFEYIPLLRNRRCLYVNPEHPWAGREAVSVNDLKGQEIGVPGEGYFDGPFLVEQCRKVGFSPRLRRFEGLDLLIHFAQTGGVSLIVENQDPSQSLNGLVPVYFKDKETFSYDIFFLFEKENENPAIQAFIHHAQTYCRQFQVRPGQ